MSEDTPKPPPRNIGLWVGLGCLGVLVLSCCLLTYWAQAYGLRWILNLSDDSKTRVSRMVLVGSLEGTRKSCSDGVVSEDSLPWFHPDMPADSRNLACSLQEATLRDLGTPERSTARSLAQADRANLATTFGMDATLCFEHSTGDVTVTGCFNADGGPGAIPYQIIDLATAR